MKGDDILWLVTGFEDKNSINKRYGFANSQGEIAIPLNYQYASAFNNGFAVVKIDNTIGVIDTNGNFVLEPLYKDLFHFKDDLFIASLDGDKYGIIDANNDVVLPFEYDRVYYNYTYKGFVIATMKKQILRIL